MNKHLSFTLSMPYAPSWDGKWSGRDKLYAITQKFSGVKGITKANEILDKTPYIFRFDDGWVAQVDVKEIDSAEKRKINKNSAGFCGYNHFVRNIVECGKITNEI